ncbi:MAG: hypothetical protein VX466_09870 [Myxococcota bacterium]|nr:hypothetical protein [Myxococcota bacterium]
MLNSASVATSYPAFLAAALVLATMAVPAPASAGPDESGTSILEEPNGFPGVCDQPCYIVEKSFEYWLPSNPDNPLPLAGNNTYIYRISHVGGSGPFVPALIGFELSVETDDVTGAGYIATSPGTAPGSSTIDAAVDVVTWDFSSVPIANGEMSKLLYVHSPLTPGTLSDISISGQASLDAAGTCHGPLYPPVQQCDLQIAKEACVVQPPDTVGDACQGKATAFTFEYTGLGCSATSHLQNPKKAKCVGGADGEEPVDILVYGKKRKRWGWNWGWWGHRRHKKTIFASVSDVMLGDSVVVDAAAAGKETLGKRVTIKIRTSDGNLTVEKDTIHTSCSQPFDPGNQFGSALVTSVTSTQGGTIDLEMDGDDCETQIDVVPGPHCLGKIKDLTLRYTAADCSATTHSQDPGKVFCVDALPATIDPVRIIISNSASPYTCQYLDVTNVNSGDLLTIDGSACGCSNLSSTTGYWIKNAITGDLIQDGYFHTSCSQSLNLEDQIGALQVFGMNTTQGGTVALGASVEYTYTVTNPNDDPVDNVSVDDDQLGNIVSGATLAPSEVAVYTTTALIEEETTNVATVNGDVAGNACVEASDTATITVAEPPEEATVCTKKIAAALLRYDGPTILGASVEFKAKSFYGEPVTYGPVDLISGVTLLSKPSENGFTIDGTAHGESSLGSKLTIRINGVAEVIHTSCSTPFATDAPAPLNNPKGAPSPNWFVIDFTEKQAGGY